MALWVDGADVVLRCTPSTSLLRGLRDAGFTATPGGCEQGECGSCTVLVDDVPLCACLVNAGAVVGGDVRTVVSIASPDPAAALARRGAVQCGFRTPGFVVSAEALLAAARVPSWDEVREALAGNLCRCTGYAGLVEAVVEVAEERFG